MSNYSTVPWGFSLRYALCNDKKHSISYSPFSLPLSGEAAPSVSCADSSPHKMGGAFRWEALRIIEIRKVDVPSLPYRGLPRFFFMLLLTRMGEK